MDKQPISFNALFRSFRPVHLGLYIVLCLCIINRGFAETKPLDELQREHVELRFGMFIHFNMNTYSTGWGNARVNPLMFNPQKLDCGQWARAAKAAGMKYAVLTCKHHDGLTLWPSQQTPPNGKTMYTVTQTSLKNRDVVREYVDSCRAYGILPGLYTSVWDVANGVEDIPSQRSWNDVKPFVMGQLRELLTNYGEVPLMIFDGWAWKFGHWTIPYQEIRDTLKKMQPNCLIVEHNGLTSAFESDVIMYEAPKKVYCVPSNTNAAMLGSTITSDSLTLSGGSWFWDSSAAKIDSLMSLTAIVRHLDTLENRYCNFLLNCPPNKDGLLDTAVVQRLAEVGQTWQPDLSRPPLPEQLKNILFPLRPDTVFVSSIISGLNPMNAIDGKSDCQDGGEVSVQTLWRTSTTAGVPQFITLDLGRIYENIDILGYLPRQDLTDYTGRIATYVISVSSDNQTFSPVTTGTWSGTDRNYKTVLFDDPQTARYVRLQANSTYGVDGVSAGSNVSVSEVNVGGYAAQPTTGVINRLAGVKTFLPGQTVFMTIGSDWNVPARFSKGTFRASAYDIRGRVIGTFLISDRTIESKGKSVLSTGVHLLKIIPVH